MCVVAIIVFVILVTLGLFRSKRYHDSVVFVDVETTGLNPQEHEIIEIAVVHATYGSVLFHSKIAPEHIDTASPEALEINGYTTEEWADAPSFEDIEDRLRNLLEGKTLAGHNTAFDKAFILAAFAKRSKIPPKVSYKVLDTATLVYEHLIPITKWAHYSLWCAATFLGMPEDTKHRASADAKAAAFVFSKLLRATWWDKLVWRIRAFRERERTTSS